MSEIIRREFSPSYIDENNYIESIIENAANEGYLSPSDCENLENELSLFLTQSLYLFKKPGFSTIREEEVERTAEAVLYFLSLRLKKETPANALKLLLSFNFSHLLNEGVAIAKANFLLARKHANCINENLFLSDNSFFIDTVKNIIPDFFKENHHCLNEGRDSLLLFDCDFDFDFCYPVLFFKEHVHGIEKVESYIEGFRYENDFLRLFDPQLVSEVCKNRTDFADMPEIFDKYSGMNFESINIFSEVLFVVLKLILCKKNPLNLKLTEKDKEYIELLFRDKTKKQINEYYKNALEQLLEVSSFSEEAKAYYRKVF